MLLKQAQAYSLNICSAQNLDNIEHLPLFTFYWPLTYVRTELIGCYIDNGITSSKELLQYSYQIQVYLNLMSPMRFTSNWKFSFLDWLEWHVSIILHTHCACNPVVTEIRTLTTVKLKASQYVWKWYWTLVSEHTWHDQVLVFWNHNLVTGW